MKICLINNLYQPYVRGGAERVVELTASKLKELGHEVVVVATRPIFSNTQNIEKPIKIYFLRAIYYNLSKWPKFLRLPWHIIDMFDFGSYFIVKAILKKERPDVVITNNLKGIGYLVPRAIRSLEIKHIHVCHDLQLIHPSGLMIYGQEKKLDSIFAKFYAYICAWLFNTTNLVIYPSRWLQEMHESRRFFQSATAVVQPNPADIVDLPAHSSIGANQSLRFLFVGQIVRHKGILFLIKTFNQLFCESRNLKCELFIVGNGPAIAEARKLVGGNEAINFLGHKSSDEVRSIMMSSDILIVPSLCYENSPTVIYEAASVGLPVIASRLGGIPELVEYLGGLLFFPENGGDLMHAMHQLATNHELFAKISRDSQIRARIYSIEKYVEKLLTIIGEYINPVS